MSRIPSRFVGLHNHTGFSPFDGLGYPDEHFKFCQENGLDAHAITEHGNMNSYAHAQLWVEKWNKERGEKPAFKYIPGVEAYYHPDLEKWAHDREANELAKEKAKGDKKERAKLQAELARAADQSEFQTKLIARVDADDETEDIEMSNALTIENEDETKSTKHFNPLNRRHHLVILPKNQKGLLQIFGACSKASLQGFYRFPRLDWKILHEAGKDGNIVVSSACIGGMPAYAVFQEVQKLKFDELNERLLDDPGLLERCITAVGNCYDSMVQAVGEGNYFLELQFNKLPAQNLVNRAILEFAKRSGVTKQLVCTADAHYFRPEYWKERELYKKLGFMNYQAYSPESLPKSKDDLKCELYPKNAQQMWDEYLKSKEGTSFYDDEVVADAIERTHDIAHQLIGEVPPDRTPKFPNERLIPPGVASFSHLVTLCKEGMLKRGLQDKSEYVARLKEELGVIKVMKNSDYFISYQKIMELARKVCLVGPGRGSGGGSLVAYVLYITDLDPIFWDLPFARFLSVYRKGAPDIDTDLADRDKVLEQLRNFFGFENVVPISNYNTFKLKTLVKDIGKFYGVSFEETNLATRTVEEEVRRAVTKHGDDKNLFVLTYEEAMGFNCSKAKEPGAKPVCSGCTDACKEKPVSPSFRTFIEKNPLVAESIKTLFKQNRSLGRHAGGVLIADDLPNKMPLVASKGEPQSPWVEGVNFKHLEYIGNFIKYDLLGLETIRLIERAIELILIKEGNPKPTFDDVKAWYETHMAPSVINFDDPKPYEVYANARWGGIFQLTSQGAQRLFVKAKPKSVIDIATLTSIYRPGPLAANVDKLYLESREGNLPPELEWGDRRINDILAKTFSCIIFQEQVMELAEKVAGFPKDKCDEVRRAIMKRSISGGEAAKKAAQETRDSFVKGCVVNGYTEKVANNLYDKILYFAGYGFNKAHAVAYAIDSFWCAWLMTYHEEQWLCSYLESMSHTPDQRAKAFGEAKALGYQIVPIDINYAALGWTVLPGKKLMPSMTSCKGVGDSAVEEIMEMRPFESIEQLMYNEDGTWRPSKFNRKAMEALIKIRAFESLQCVGPEKVFKSYKHMYETLMGQFTETVTRKRKGVEETVEVVRDHGNMIKRSTKKDPHEGRKKFYELARGLAEIGGEEWTRKEMAELHSQVFGSVDVMMMFEQSLFDKLAARITSVEELEVGKTSLVWFVTVVSGKKGKTPTAGAMKKTRNGKEYAQIFVAGPTGKPMRINVWGAKQLYEPYKLFCSEVKRDDFGLSTTTWKTKEVA
jgi:DNA polymerase-3 subunit alpha